MTHFKLILSLSLLLFSATFSHGQKRVSYYDLYEIIKSGDDDKAYTLLLTVQKQDPDFANTYFQLGLIAYKWSMEFNPFTEFEYTKLFIYNTKLYFNLAKLKIEGDKKKNLEYYTNAVNNNEGIKITFEEVITFIDKKVAAINEYEENISKIINFFNRSSDKYNDCVNTFMQINTEYAIIKNIYLTENPEFIATLNQLENGFDSTIFYFQKYKEALRKYPLKGYDQNYRLKDIITYRLDGLTNSNFLKNDIPLWDYKKWVLGVKKIKKESVSANGQEISGLNSEIRNQINHLSKDEFSDENKPYKLDDKFVYKIEKYDYNSMLIKLFKLNEAKINFLTQCRKEINNPNNIRKYSLYNSSVFYYNMTQKKLIADSINRAFSSQINAEQVKKYHSFYGSEYGAMEGLKKYSVKQANEFDEKLKSSFNYLKNKLYLTAYNLNWDSLYYNKKSIKMQKNFLTLLTPEVNKYVVLDFKQDNTEKYCFSGYYKGTDSKIQGFSACTKNLKELSFLKQSKSDSSNVIHLLTESFQGGSFSMETSIGKTIKNTLIKYSEEGKEVAKKAIPYNRIPRFMIYDDINNSIIIVLNGSDLDPVNESNNDEQIIYHLNLEDDLKSYAVRMNAKCYVFDILKVENRILIFSNYVYFLNHDGVGSWSKAGITNFDTNILITVISPEGIIEKQVPVNNEQAFLGTKAIKINSNTINILGFKSKFISNSHTHLKDKELYYLVLNSDLKELYSSWHD